MSDINVVVLTGHLTKDPVIKQKSNGKEMASFTIGNNPDFGEHAKASFLYCISHNRVEWLKNHVKKGTGVQIRGKVKTFLTGEGEEKRTVTFIDVAEISYMPKSGNGNSNDGSENAKGNSGALNQTNNADSADFGDLGDFDLGDLDFSDEEIPF